MHIKFAFLAGLILCVASPAQATFEEEEVAYILFGLGKQDVGDGLKTFDDTSLNSVSNSLQIEPANKNWYLSITRRGECIYNVEYGEVARGSTKYTGRPYYVDLSALSAVELSKPSVGRRPKVRVIGGHVGCPVNMRTEYDGCTIEQISTASLKSINKFARSFSDRFCVGIRGKILT